MLRMRSTNPVFQRAAGNHQFVLNASSNTPKSLIMGEIAHPPIRVIAQKEVYSARHWLLRKDCIDGCWKFHLKRCRGRVPAVSIQQGIRTRAGGEKYPSIWKDPHRISFRNQNVPDGCVPLSTVRDKAEMLPLPPQRKEQAEKQEKNQEAIFHQSIPLLVKLSQPPNNNCLRNPQKMLPQDDVVASFPSFLLHFLNLTE